jgi:hypothetical protein
MKTNASHNVTTAKINKALAEAGLRGELVKSTGYFYFSGPSFDHCREQGVYGVHRLGDLTVEQWVQEARSKVEEV